MATEVTQNHQKYNAAREHENNTFGTKLTMARKAADLKQSELVLLLKEYGVNISIQAYSKWETGFATPNPYQVFALIAALNIRYPVAFFTDQNSQNLNQEGRRKIAEYTRLLEASGLYSENQTIRTVRVFDVPVSAGTGITLDESPCEEMQLSLSPSELAADFAVRISGDSMEPRFSDGQIVCIRKTSELKPGQVGIFLYDGNTYIKTLEQFSNGRYALISDNPKYDPIVVNPALSFSVLGQVISQ